MSRGCGESLRRKMNLMAEELSEGFLLAKLDEAQTANSNLINDLKLLCDTWDKRQLAECDEGVPLFERITKNISGACIADLKDVIRRYENE